MHAHRKKLLAPDTTVHIMSSTENTPDPISKRIALAEFKHLCRHQWTPDPRLGDVVDDIVRRHGSIDLIFYEAAVRCRPLNTAILLTLEKYRNNTDRCRKLWATALVAAAECGYFDFLANFAERNPGDPVLRDKPLVALAQRALASVVACGGDAWRSCAALRTMVAARYFDRQRLCDELGEEVAQYVLDGIYASAGRRPPIQRRTEWHSERVLVCASVTYPDFHELAELRAQSQSITFDVPLAMGKCIASLDEWPYARYHRWSAGRARAAMFIVAHPRVSAPSITYIKLVTCDRIRRLPVARRWLYMLPVSEVLADLLAPLRRERDAVARARERAIATHNGGDSVVVLMIILRQLDVAFRAWGRRMRQFLPIVGAPESMGGDGVVLTARELDSELVTRNPSPPSAAEIAYAGAVRDVLVRCQRIFGTLSLAKDRDYTDPQMVVLSALLRQALHTLVAINTNHIPDGAPPPSWIVKPVDVLNFPSALGGGDQERLVRKVLDHNRSMFKEFYKPDPDDDDDTSDDDSSDDEPPLRRRDNDTTEEEEDDDDDDDSDDDDQPLRLRATV